LDKKLIFFCFLVIPFISFYQTAGAEHPESENTLAEEDLIFMEVPTVTTAAKKEQKQPETAAATYVITKEDIRRSGATTIPELLRMVPGLDVAQIDANKWAVSARGFNGSFTNELLVLIDGRSVYTPLFSGVYWDVQDTLLEDIERIEILRGPGGALWGANAVNGVINIITKSAKDTRGGLATAGTGSQERGFGSLRYGVKAGENVYFRTYAKYFNRDDFVEGHDQWNSQRGGFRMDWDVSLRDTLTVLGDVYDGDADQILKTTSLSPPGSLQSTGTIDYNGGNTLLRWQRRLSKESDFTLQTFFDNAERDDQVLFQRINTYDVDFQHRFPLATNQEIIWGAGYRLIGDRLGDSFTVSFDPDNKYNQVGSVFLQDEIALRDDMRLTLGTKLEHNDYTGFEIQPNARFLWKFKENQSLWSAVSRAVRTPSRSYSDIRINTAAFTDSRDGENLVAIFGNPGLQSEDLIAYEIGYRNQINRAISLDIATFYNVYDNLVTLESGVPVYEMEQTSPHLLFPLYMEDLMEGRTYGVEMNANWQAVRCLRLSPGYTWLQMNMRPKAESNDTRSGNKMEGSSPEHQLQLRSYLNLPHNLEYDTAAYYVTGLDSLDVPSYLRLDMRLGWRPRKNLELSLSAQNLLDGSHEEFAADDVVESKVPRSIYAKIEWRF